MRAIRQHEHGGPEVLQWVPYPDPVPGPGEVRVVVEAAGVHLLDTALRAGTTYTTTTGPELPTTPGREVAGVVDRVGPGVDASWRGRRVVAHLGPGSSGGYAELALVEASRLHDLPEGLTPAVAVAAIGTGRTAAGILDLAAITSDDVVVVTSAAGGLGVLLLQGARAAGARTVGVTTTAKVPLVRHVGADRVVDRRSPGWAEELRAAEPRLTLLLDGVGGEVPRRLFSLLAPGGRMVRFSGDTEGYAAPDRTVVDVLGPTLMSRIPELEKAALVAAADGTRVPHVGSVFPMERAADAHRALEAGQTTGKVVLLTAAGARAGGDR